ncbi:MAG: 1,4-alpha-glucan branching protein GlgB [Lachnospiraceae bacterium]|nr:1,4-alpha-glucan branching protein GlgB [Lachnospiraceae bacterium]
MDFQSFYSGNLFTAYDYLGAHPMDGGFIFRVYAPAAYRVALIGEFSDWGEIAMNKIYDGQFYEVFVEEAKQGQLYKYRIYRDEYHSLDHCDPYGFYSERRPGTASVTYDLSFAFQDEEWIKSRRESRDRALNIYEVHAGSWIRKEAWDGEGDPAQGWVTYRELADKLIPYLKKHHYTGLELMPLAEYPADESWGYQETGFFSATSRYGEPCDLQYLVDSCHRQGLAVILDVVTVHFAVNDYGLWNFDGSSLYEYPHPAVGYSEWGSCNFMHSRGDVRSFLQSACAFWLDKYHFDGLRFDAVGNLIYWQGNSGRGINLDAVRFMQRMNEGLKETYPDAMLIAEDSTSYYGTTKPVSENGLGFDYKWDLGWMNDTLGFMGEDPGDRGRDIGKLLLSMDYFYNENYLLPLSHDEVVHGKGTIVNKMAGDLKEGMAQIRLLYLYMFTHPGKKLNFMGNELAQLREWDEKRELDWDLLKSRDHADFQAYISALNRFYEANPALWQRDYDSSAFRWIQRGEKGDGVLAFTRCSEEQELLVVLNFSDKSRVFSHEILEKAGPVLRTQLEGGQDDRPGSLCLLPFEGVVLEREKG